MRKSVLSRQIKYLQKNPINSATLIYLNKTATFLQGSSARGFVWMTVVNLTGGSNLVTYLSGINNTTFNKISSSYSTESQYTNLI